VGIVNNHAAAKRGIPSKDDFNSWYPFIVEAAELVDKRYPIKGMDVWRPYGWKTMRLIDSLTHSQMEATGHEEYRFPLLIPEALLDKENRLVARLKAAREAGVDPSDLRMEEEQAGFENEVYWVRHAGASQIDEAMFLRPTSETAMYTMFPLWIRSHADLPLKTYQMVNTFRYETKQTRSFIRVREIHFFEAHTAHEDEASASEQIEEDLEIVQSIAKDICLPVLLSKRPLWDTFPGAWYTIGVDVVMPNGRTLQIASCHHYRDQWAQAFDIRYEDENGKQQFVHQTTYGMSERLVGAIVGMHGDDSGLIMPPSIAPIQVIIIPILSRERGEDVLTSSKQVSALLMGQGLRVHIDDREIRPGQKYYDWEIKGVPLRIEIGPRDLDSNQVMVARRTGGKSPIPIDDLAILVNDELMAVSDELWTRARQQLEEYVHPLPSINRAGDKWELSAPLIDDKVYFLFWEGSDADAERLEHLTGLSFLGTEVGHNKGKGVCAVTGKPTSTIIHMARMY